MFLHKRCNASSLLQAGTAADTPQADRPVSRAAGRWQGARCLAVILLIGLASPGLAPRLARADCHSWDRNCNGTAANGGTIDGYGNTWTQNVNGGYTDQNGRTWSQTVNGGEVRSDGYSVHQNMGGGYTDSKGENFSQGMGGGWVGDRGTACTQLISGVWRCQ